MITYLGEMLIMDYIFFSKMDYINNKDNI